MPIVGRGGYRTVLQPLGLAHLSIVWPRAEGQGALRSSPADSGDGWRQGSRDAGSPAGELRGCPRCHGVSAQPQEASVWED